MDHMYLWDLMGRMDDRDPLEQQDLTGQQESVEQQDQWEPMDHMYLWVLKGQMDPKDPFLDQWDPMEQQDLMYQWVSMDTHRAHLGSYG